MRQHRAGKDAPAQLTPVFMRKIVHKPMQLPTNPPLQSETSPLARIQQEVVAAAAAFGVHDATALAAAVADRISIALGGAEHYIPKPGGCRRQRSARDAAIAAAFNGRNAAELARLHGISVRRVRQILQV